MLPHLLYIYNVTRTNYLTDTYRLVIFWSSIWRDPIQIQCRIYFLMWPSMSLYDVYDLQYWNLSTVTGVTPTHSCGQISKWVQTLIDYTYLLVVMTPMIRSINFLNSFPWSVLVIKYPAIPFVGHHYTSTSLFFILYVTKNNHMLMWLVLLLTKALPFFSVIMALWLSL